VSWRVGGRRGVRTLPAAWGRAASHRSTQTGVADRPALGRLGLVPPSWCSPRLRPRVSPSASHWTRRRSRCSPPGRWRSSPATASPPPRGLRHCRDPALPAPRYPYGPVFLSLIIALFTAVTNGYRVAAWLAAGALYVGHFGLGYLFGRPPPLTLAVLVGVAAWLLVVAEVVRVLRERAAEAARVQAEEARRRAGEERLRVARELHDVLAHNISDLEGCSGQPDRVVGLDRFSGSPAVSSRGPRVAQCDETSTPVKPRLGRWRPDPSERHRASFRRA
jgi:hypothetical protein